MENAPKITVIVPVYQAEKYLHDCVNSILSQSVSDFQLILVDDGSPDNCGKLCDDYAACTRRTPARPPPGIWRWKRRQGSGCALWTATTGYTRTC